MSELIQGILIALIPGLLISIVTAYVTVRLSLRQFYSQRWWEKKAEAYSSIIEQLSHLQYRLEQWFSEQIGATILSDEEQERFREGYREVEEALRKTAAAGAYIVSEDTATALREVKEVFREPDARYNVGNWLKEMEKDYVAVKECITKIRGYAKQDLGMK